MGELEPIIAGQPEMAPVIVIGGVLTEPWMRRLYSGLLGNDELPANQRFISIPKKVLGPPEQVITYFDEQLMGILEQFDEPAVVIGHSLGGLAAELAGLSHPDRVKAVMMVAGAQRGYAQMTFGMGLLQAAINLPREAAEMYCGSDFMQEQQRRVATEWPEDVSYHVVSPTTDNLIPAPQGLAIELPPGQIVNRYVVAPSIGMVHNSLRRVRDMPLDTQVLSSRFITTHYGISANNALIRHSRDVRRVTAASDALATVQSHPYLFGNHDWRSRSAWQPNSQSEIPCCSLKFFLNVIDQITQFGGLFELQVSRY